MSQPLNLRARVRQYLRERRRLGFQLRSMGYALRSFAHHVDKLENPGPLTVEMMAEWARRDRAGSNDPRTWARRLKILRPFTRWLQQFEPRTEVPDDAIFGRVGERLTPHIYSEQELVDLLAVARHLRPDLRGATYEALFGLLAATGLRVSEAVLLRTGDVDLKTGMLTIQRTKFAKSRQVPLHPSTVAALRRYRRLRDPLIDFDQRHPILRRLARTAPWTPAQHPPGRSDCLLSCGRNSPGPTAVRILPRVSTIFATASSCAECSLGTQKASISIRRCWPYPLTSDMRW